MSNMTNTSKKIVVPYKTFLQERYLVRSTTAPVVVFHTPYQGCEWGCDSCYECHRGEELRHAWERERKALKEALRRERDAATCATKPPRGEDELPF